MNSGGGDSRVVLNVGGEIGSVEPRQPPRGVGAEFLDGRDGFRSP